MALKLAGMKVGDVHEAVVVDGLTRTQLVQYAGASGDYNPLHTDEVYATQVGGYPAVFSHGMLTMGLAAKMVTDLVGDGRLTKLGGRFKAQVWPGDVLTTTVVVREIRPAEGLADLDFTVRNERGVEVLTGSTTVRVDD